MAADIEIIEGTIPGLARLVEFTRLFVQNDAALRKIQAQNAPRAMFGQPLALPGLAFVDASAVYRLPANFSNAAVFSTMVVIIDGTSGSARYRLDGADPSPVVAPTSGILIPAGGTVLTIDGTDNIRQWAIIAEVANQITGWVQPFV